MAGRVVRLTRRDTGVMINLLTQEIKRVEPAKDDQGGARLLLVGPSRELFVRQSDAEVKRLMGEP
jgi:hypothetical protein